MIASLFLGALLATAPPASAADGQLAYSTFIGGREEEMGVEVEVDAAGARYVAGGTSSEDYPFTDVAPERKRRWFTVATITKIAPDSSVAYSTFVPGWNFAQGLAVDDEGNAFVVGSVVEDLPATEGAFDTTGNGEGDVFVAKLAPSGELEWATYLGGQLPDGATDVELDEAGNVNVSGYTFSNNFPVTSDAVQAKRGGGYDVFVSKLSPDGSQLDYSTFFGGKASEGRYELVFSVDTALEVDSSGQIYFAGSTMSDDFPATIKMGDPDLGFGDGFADAFIVKLAPGMPDPVFSMVFGGHQLDGVADIDVDGTGTVYATGTTRSDDLPTTEGAYDREIGRFDRGDRDGFVGKLRPDGSGFDYLTYLGGKGSDELSTIEALENGRVYVSGSGSIGYPVTSDAFNPFPLFTDLIQQWAKEQPFGDVVLTLVDETGSALEYSTFLGGTDYELTRDLEVAGDDVLLLGYSTSHNFPTTTDALQPTAQEPGAHNIFLTTLSPGGVPCTHRGTDAAEELAGSPANDLICGFDGDDSIAAGPGNDLVYSGDGNDRVLGEGGYDVVLAGAGDDEVFGGHEPDSLFGEGGDDSIRVGRGNDKMHVGPNEDQLLVGGGGMDSLVGSQVGDLAVGGPDADELRGRAGNDRLSGSEGDDSLQGGSDRDRCRGGPGDNSFSSCEERPD